MKRALMIFLSAFLLLGCLSSAYAEETYALSEDGYMQGYMVIDGHEISLDALFDGEIPKQLKNILLEAAGHTHQQIREVIDRFFTPVDDLDHRWGSSPKGTYSFYSLVGGPGPSQTVMDDYHEISAGIQDEALAKVVAQCKALLDALGVSYYPIPNFASYYTVKQLPSGGFEGNAVTQAEAAHIENLRCSVVLSLVVDGVMLPPGYTGDMGSSDGVNGDNVLVDDPTANFHFDERGRLITFSVSTYAIKEEAIIHEPLLSWQEALESWHRELSAEDYAADYFAQCDMKITRIQYVWLTSFRNVLRPGWYFELVTPNKETGEPDGYWVYSFGVGVDAMTGGV